MSKTIGSALWGKKGGGARPRVIAAAVAGASWSSAAWTSASGSSASWRSASWSSAIARTSLDLTGNALSDGEGEG